MSSSLDGIEFDLIPENRPEEVILHLRKSFFYDEPLNKSMGLCLAGEPHEGLEKHSLATLSDNVSIMATSTDDGRILGVSLNGILKDTDMEKAHQRLSEMTDLKFKKIIGLLHDINYDLKIFERYDVDEIFEIRILSVDESARGRGLATHLLQKSIDLARERGFRIAKMDATGAYSQRAACKLGMETIHELCYRDYVVNGCRVFHTEPPHKSLKMMVKVLG